MRCLLRGADASLSNPSRGLFAKSPIDCTGNDGLNSLSSLCARAKRWRGFNEPDDFNGHFDRER